MGGESPISNPYELRKKKLMELLGIKDEFSFHERCLQEGICPNGCGPMAVKSSKESVCGECGFRHWNATPDRKPHATE